MRGGPARELERRRAAAEFAQDLDELARIAEEADERGLRDVAYSARQNVRFLTRRAALAEGRDWTDPYPPAAPAPAEHARILVVRGGEQAERQRLDYTVGVSERACGAKHISLSYVVFPPGAVSEPHYHDGYETAIYQLEGRVETRFGERLEEVVVTEAGDFLYVPPGVPHQAANLSETERVVAIVARNEANDAERTVPWKLEE